MKRRFAFALLTVALQGCVTCRFEYDEGREVKIVEVTPQDDWHTGLRQRFGIQVTDSFDAPEQLRVSVDIDAKATRWCERATALVVDHAVEWERRRWMPSRTINNFWCPIEPEDLPKGRHTLRYRVWNRDGDVAAANAVTFEHHPQPPTLFVDHDVAADGERIAWSADGDDVREVTVHIGVLRIFSSRQAHGEAVLDAALLPAGRPLRVRAYDMVGNVTEAEVVR